MLFYDCLKVVLSSVALVKHGTRVLPKRIIHLALFIACKSSNYSIIKAILTAWPHSEISFDFMTNSLCRRYVASQEQCLCVQEYLNIRYSELLTHCIPSIALGIFCNILEQQKRHLEPVLIVINMASFRFTDQSNFMVINKLAEGLYPVNHPNDYISSSDKKAITLTTPKLHCVQNKIKLILFVEISTYVTFKCLQKLLHNKFIFNTQLTGTSLCRSLPPSRHSEILSYFSDLNFNHISYDASLINATQSLPRLESGGCLHLFSHQNTPLYHNYKIMCDKLLTNNIHKPFVLVLGNYENELFTLFAKNYCVCSIAVLPEVEYSYNKLSHSCNGLISVLHNNSSTLEYVQLHRFPTSLVGVLNIHALSNLRVLSITSRTSKGQGLSNPIIDMCKLLKQLNLLEFMEWGDVINLFFKDLIAIHDILKAHLPRLIHWHMHSFKLVLFTVISDIEKEVLGNLHNSLMKNKTGDEACSTYMLPLDTYHMKNWLQKTRPNICINLKRNTKSNDWNSIS